MRRLTFALLAMALSGCALPVRDNPIDPLNAPVAELHVIDRGDPDAVTGCPVVDADDIFAEIVSASRGRCLALDARQTSSPRDHELTLAFTLHDSAGALIAAPDYVGDSQVLPLESLLRELPIGDPIVAKLVVTDEKLDVTLEVSATFELENASPELVVDRPRSFPLGGFPWAFGEDFDVDFSIAGSTDPDGDPLYVRFTFPDGTVEDLGPVAPEAGPITTHAFDADAPRAYPVKVELFDGPDGSPRAAARPLRTIVRVHEPSPWIHLGKGGGTVSRLDPTRFELSEPSITAPSAVGGPANIGGLTYRSSATAVGVARSQVNELQTFSWPDAQQFATLFLGGGSDNEAAFLVGDEGEVWRIGKSIAPRVRRFQIAPGSVTPSPVATSPGDELEFDGNPLRGVVSLDGDAWVMEEGSSQYFFIAVLDTGAGAFLETTPHAMPGRSLVDMKRRPSTDEVWILDDASSGGDPWLHKLTAPGVIAESWEIAANDATALAWAADDAFWLAHGTLGLIRVDALVLDGASGTPIEAAVLDEFSISGIDSILADPDSGTAWASSKIHDVAWRVDTRGHVDVLPSAEHFFAVDPTGSALFAGIDSGISQRVGRASSTTSGGRDRTMPFAALAGGGPDLRTGGAWLYRPGGEIVNVDEEGTVLARRRNIRIGSQEELLPALASFKPSLDGTYAWAVELDASTSGRVLRLDLREEPMPAVVVFADADDITPGSPDAYILGAPHHPILEPSAPSGHEAWFVRYEVFTPLNVRVAIVGSSGVLTEIPSNGGDIPERFGTIIARAAVTPASDTLCLAAWDGVVNELRVRRIHRDGTVDLFVTNELPLATNGLSVVAASSDDSADYCWVAWQDGGDSFVRAYADAGPVAVRSIDLPAGLSPIHVTSIVPFGGETLWVSTVTSAPAGPAFIRRYDFLLNGTRETSLGQLGTVPGYFPNDAPAFLSPQSPVQRYQ